MSTQTKSGRRTVLQDNSWIRRNAEEDESIDDDPNFGKVVLSQKKPVDNVINKSVEAEKPLVNSGKTFSSFSKSPASVNTSISAIVPPAPKPPVPAKNPVLKTPSPSSFTARVFSGANTSSKASSPVKPSFGEKPPELTPSQTNNGISPSAAPATATSTAVKSSSVSSPVKSSTRSESVSVSTLKSSTPSQSESVSVSTLKSSTPSQSQSKSVSVSTLKSSTPSQSESVSVSTLKSSTPSQSQSESVSVSTLKSSTPSQSESVSVSTLKSLTPSQSQSESVSVSTLKSLTPSQSQTSVTNTKTSSALAESLSSGPSEKTSARYSPSAVSLNTHYSSQTHSAPLEDLTGSLLSGRVQSQPGRSQAQVRTVDSGTPAAPPALRPQSSSRVISRDACTVCGKPIAGDGKMILEELNINSHTSCFRCAVCRCDLGGLEAGKSLWVLRERIHCSNCFSNIRGQWYI